MAAEFLSQNLLLVDTGDKSPNPVHTNDSNNSNIKTSTSATSKQEQQQEEEQRQQTSDPVSFVTNTFQRDVTNRR